MGKIRLLLIIMVLAGLGFLGAMTWLQLKPDRGKKENTLPSPTAADLELKKVKYTETRDGVKEWELEAYSVGYFREGGSVVCEKIKATFFGSNGVAYTLVGEKGKFCTKSKVMEVFAGVKIHSSDGYHLRTDSLKYLAERKELVTADLVEMQGPRFWVQGWGAIVDLEQQKVKILNQVRTTFADIDIKKAED